MITGQKGQGKSSLIRRTLTELASFICLDVKREFSVSGPDGEMVRTFPDWFDAAQAGRKQFVCQFQENLDVIYLLRAMRHVKNTCLVLDETAVAYGIAPKELEWLINYGRHNRIDMIFAVRRAVEIPPVLRAQMDRLIAFHQVEPRDLEWLQQNFDMDPERVKALKGPTKESGYIGEYLEWPQT